MCLIYDEALSNVKHGNQNNDREIPSREYYSRSTNEIFQTYAILCLLVTIRHWTIVSENILY